jgi:hypothetical protein
MTSFKSWKYHICAALLLGSISIQAAIAAPVLSASATPAPATVGSTLNVDVSIADINNLFGYQFTLLFDPALLQATGAGTEGAFLATGGTTFFDGGTVDNTLGSISFTFAALIGNVPGVNGSGSLASFGFNVIGAGAGALSFSDLLFIDMDFNDLGVLAQDLDFTAVAAGSDVPEPSAYWLFAIGLTGFAVSRRRQSTPT